MPNVLDTPAASGPFQLLIVGPFKSGKTWGALTFPRPNVIDFDRGIEVVNNPEWSAKFGRRSIEYEQFKEKKVNARGVATDHNAFDDACRYFDKWMKPDMVDRFDTWVIDSGTTLSESAAIKARVLLGGTSFGKPLSQTQAQAVATGLVIPKMQDFGAERSMVEQFVDMVKDSGKHLVLCCHEKILTDDEGITTAYVPLLTGQSAERIPLKFDEVYHLIVSKKGDTWERKLQTQATSLRRCGSRMGVKNGTAWEWDAIQAELTRIRSAQAQSGNGQTSANTPTR
jgi:hypothetical protein